MWVEESGEVWYKSQTKWKCLNCLLGAVWPDWVGDISILWYPQQLVWSCYGVEVGVQTIMEVGVGLPYLLQHRNIQTLNIWNLVIRTDLQRFTDREQLFDRREKERLLSRFHNVPELVDHQMVCVILQSFEAESVISPILAEVAVHGVVLQNTISQHLTSV